jgi:hypothetical protein
MVLVELIGPSKCGFATILSVFYFIFLFQVAPLVGMLTAGTNAIKVRLGHNFTILMYEYECLMADPQ